MTVYAVGDLQGCLDPLKKLLDRVTFDTAHDTLWLTGDLVNRGAQSLATLRFVKSLGTAGISVLGNHDLHLLAVAHTGRKLKKNDTLGEILAAPDAAELLDWLRHQPLIHADSSHNAVLVHAGIPHIWSTKQALSYAQEVEGVLRSNQYIEYLENMYGNTPDIWSDTLIGMPRYRIITNYLTRMRFIAPSGRLELLTKTGAVDAPSGYKPWFTYLATSGANTRILFGHWAALHGDTGHPSCIALDTGCVWGQEMKLVRLPDLQTWLTPCCNQ